MLRIAVGVWMLALSTVASAADDDAFDLLMTLPNVEERAEWLTVRLAQDRDDAGARSRWAASLIVTQELADASPGVQAVYLLTALDPDPVLQEHAVRAARAGGHIDGNGQPMVPEVVEVPGEAIEGQPRPGHRAYRAFQEYSAGHLSLACILADLETTGGARPFTAGDAPPEASVFKADVTWTVVRGDGHTVLGRGVIDAFASQGIELPTPGCPFGERRKCVDLPTVERWLPVYNQRLAASLGLADDQVMLVNRAIDPNWRACLGRDGRARPIRDRGLRDRSR